jgi:hypothetical protein
MASYEQLLKFPINYADPVIDVVTLAIRTYGKDGARLYLDKKLKPSMANDLFLLASQIIDDEPRVDIEKLIIEDKITFPPLASYFVGRAIQHVNLFKIPPKQMGVATFKAVDIVRSSYNDGTFLSFFLDQLRGEQNAKMVLDFHQALTPAYKRRLLSPFSVDVRYGRFATVYVRDQMDRAKPIIVCLHSKNGNEVCGNPDTYGEFDKRVGVSGEWHNIKLQRDQCIYSISYYDTRGFFHTLKGNDVEFNFDNMPKENMDTDYITSCYHNANAKAESAAPNIVNDSKTSRVLK